MNTRFLIIISLLIPCCVACSTIEVQTQAPYQSSEFRSSDLKVSGVALLPVTNREYDNIIQQTTVDYLYPLINNAFLQPGTVAQQLNDTNTLSIYRDAVETYSKTGIIDRKKFHQIGTVLGVRYLLKIDPGIITTQQETTSSTSFYDDVVDINTTETRKNTTSAIIIDCSNGEVVWKGITKASAGDGDFFNRHTNNDIVGKNVSALMEKLIYKSNNY